MFKNATLNMIDRAIMVVVRFLATILIARVLGPEGNGVFQFALTASIVAASFADFGLGIANNYLASRYPYIRAKLFGNAVIFVGLLSIITAIGSVAIIQAFHSNFFPELPKTYLWWIPLSVPIQALQISLIGLTYGANKFKDKVIGTCLQYVVFLCAIVLFTLLDYLSINILMPLWVVGLSISSLYWIRVLWKDAPSMPKWDRAVLKKQLSYGRNSYLYNAASMLNFRLDLFLVAYFLNAKSVGWYALATSITEAFLYFPKALANVVLSEVATQLKNGAKANLHLVYKVVLLIIGSAMIVTAILAPLVVPLIFSSSFTPSIVPLLLLLPGTLAMALGIIASYHLFGLGKSFQPSLAAFIAVAVTIILDLLLIPLLGIKGAALASTLTYIAFLIVCLYFVLSSEEGVSVRSLLIPMRKDIATMLLIVKGCNIMSIMYKYIASYTK